MADQASPPSNLVDDTNGALPTTEASLPDADAPAATADTVAADAPAVADEASELTAEPARAAIDGAEANHDDLLGELARAMHAAATSQYERMNAELERRRTEQIESIAARASSEVENLKAGSEGDISAIDAWAKSESEKIKHERLRRIDARREQLASQLERQETIKEREVFSIDVAIDAHRNEIDLFFGRMERETDPAAIARVASTVPPFPPLDEIAEGARRGAAAEFASLEAEAEPAAAVGESETEASVSDSRLMAVMDPAASRAGDGDIARAWEAPYAVSVAAGTSVEDGDAEAEAPSRVGATLLRTVRAIRPMADRHDRGGEERDTHR